MGESFIKKNGLLYSSDLHTIYGVDTSSTLFTGRVPYGVHYIQDEAFADTNYISISLPDSVKQLGSGLFGNCTSLQKVKLPSELTELSPYLFAGCSSLKSVTFPTQIKTFAEGMFFNCSSLEEVPFRIGIETLPDYVFAECKSLTSIVFPESVNYIGAKAFSNCKNLTSIVLPSNIQTIKPDAFEGCENLHNIRISGDNKIFYLSEDGSLYERTAEGDKLVIKVYPVSHQIVNFYEENLNDDDIISDEEDLEDDDFFSAEIGQGDEELLFGNISENIVTSELKEIEVSKNEPEPIQNEIMETTREENMTNSNEMDSIFEDIMNDERKRTESVTDIGISDKESMVLTEMMDVMKDAPASANDNAKVSNEELERLTEATEKEATENTEKIDYTKLDSKQTILVNSVKFSKVYYFESDEEIENPDLYVIAETTTNHSDGREDFSSKLTACCKKIAEIQGFKRVIMLAGLPFDNEEFMHFYYPFINKKNVILACDANSPATLSDYCKKVCEQSRINLEKEVLTEQRKRVNIKNDTLIKLVIKDIK